MSNARRLKAFTILEVSITMLIAAILIGITYTAYTIVSKSYLSFHSKNQDMAEVEQLDDWLKKDFDNAIIIQKETDGISLEKSDQRKIKYNFNTDFVVRISDRIDTFNIKTKALNTLFEGQIINEVNPSTEQNRLDELGFTLVFKNEEIPCHYYKIYSSVNLIERNPNAIN